MRNRRVSILQSNPLWGPRHNYVVLMSMVGTTLIAVVNLYGPGLQDVFDTTPIPGMFWGIPFAFALGILTMDEIRKLIVRTYPKVRISGGPSLSTLFDIVVRLLVSYCEDGLVTMVIVALSVLAA